MSKIIRFSVVDGKLTAEAIGMQGKVCEAAIKLTLSKMKLSAVEGSENHKPEYLLETDKERSVVAG